MGQDVRPIFWLREARCRWSKTDANAILADKCFVENNRWVDFPEWRACQARLTKWGGIPRIANELYPQWFSVSKTSGAGSSAG